MRILPLFITTAFSFFCHAQHHLGIATSNYGGTNSVFLNPANVAGSPYETYFHLGGVEGYISNNYVSWDAPYTLVQYLTKNVPAKYIKPNGKVEFNHTFLKERLSTKPYSAHVGMEVRGPSVMFNGKNCTSFAITSRVRTAVNATQFDASLAQYLKVYGLNRDYLSLGNIDAQFDFNANSFHELGFSIGKVYDDDSYRFKIGMMAKYLTGLMNIHLISDNFDFQIVPDPSTGSIGLNDLALLLNDVNMRYGYENSGVIPNLLLKNEPLQSQKISGHGLGFDAGFVFEKKSSDWQSHKTQKYGLKSNYDFKISMSALDIGWIRYATPNVKYYEVQTNNVLVQNATLKQIKNTASFFDTINGLLGVSSTPTSRSYGSFLPSSLVFSIDQRILKKVFVNALVVQNMKPSNQIGMMQQSTLALTPRFESRFLDVAAPITFNNYRTFQFGIASRIGPVYFGTENILGLLSINNPQGLEGYCGVALPIYNKSSKITDCSTVNKDRNFSRRIKNIRRGKTSRF